MNTEELGKIIKERRKQLNVRQEDLAMVAKISIRTLKKIESGHANPKLDTLHKVMDTLGFVLTIELKSPPILDEKC